MDLRQLVRAFDGGRIDADTLVWRKGMPDWRRLRDVAELAERLMGADATKATAPDPAFEQLRSESDPPPRHPEKQPERSRTPPANYSVATGDARASSPPIERSSAATTSPAAHKSVPDDSHDSIARDDVRVGQLGTDKDDVVVPTLQGGSMPATPAGGYSSPAPPRTSARPERRSVPSPRPAALAGRAPIVGDPPRTITQTGLAPAPDPAHRLVQAQDNAEAPITEGPEAARNGAAAVVAPRVSRTPAPGPRRVPSSDETPAQKPSSISVPSGALAPAPSRIRTKHVVALGGLVLGLGLIVSGTLSSESVPSAPGISSVAAPSAVSTVALPEPPHIENRVENRNALVPEPLPPEPAKPRSVPTTAAPQPAVVSPAASNRAIAAAPVGSSAAARPAPAVPAKPAASPKSTAQASILDIRPSEPAPAGVVAGAATSAGVPVTGRGELGAPATPAPPLEPAPAAAAAPDSATPPATPPRATSPAVPPPATPPRATSPAAAPPPVAPAGAGTEPVTAPAPFDVQRAKVQLGIAAFKASTCGSLGGARGAGDVAVVIESFGRVTRVTHSNPAFIGTPIGTCVTQAYQQVQVPPFSGAPQTLTSSFVVP